MPVSDLPTARKVIEEAFETAWAARTPVRYMGENFVPPETGEWTKFDIIWAEGTQLSMAHTDTVGVLSASFLAKPGKGFALIEGHAQAFRVIFNRKTIVDGTDRVHFKAASGPRVVTGDPIWDQVNVTIPFEVVEVL